MNITKKTIKVVGSLLLCTAVLFISCNAKDVTDNHKSLVVASDSSAPKYQCPMKCQNDTCYTTAGKCPVCEMDLEKK